MLKLLDFSMMGLPSTLTVVEPSAVSDDCAMFGYGIGMGEGDGGAGVLHTSGNAMAMPLLPESPS